MTHDMPSQLPFSEASAQGEPQHVMQAEFRRLLREEVFGALKDFFSDSSIARGSAGETGIEREPAPSSKAASAINMIGDLVNAHHSNLQGLSMDHMDDPSSDRPFCPDSKWLFDKRVAFDGKQNCGLTESGVDSQQDGERNDILDIGSKRLEARLSMLLREHFGILSDRLHARCADLMNGQIGRILQLVNEQRTLAGDVTSDSKRQSDVLRSPSPPSSRPNGLIESAQPQRRPSIASASDSPQTTVQLCDIFAGAWEDIDGKFYGGALIVFESESWKPLNPSEPAQRKAEYRLRPLSETQCYLYETRLDGTSRCFLATADSAQPDHLVVALKDSRMKWTLRHVSQEECTRRACGGKLHLNQEETAVQDKPTVLGRLIDVADQLAGRLSHQDKSKEPEEPQRQRSHKIKAVYRSFLALKEPERIGPLARTIESGAFKFLCTATILVQAVYSTLAMNEAMEKAEQGDVYEDNAYVEGAFLAFYSVELLLRLLVHRLYFFINDQCTWNVFDFALVVQSAVEMLIEVVLKGNSGVDMAFLRPLRIFKIAKVLRTFRALKYFTEIRLMLFCILQSLSTLFWCLTLIVFVQYLFSMLFVQGLAEYMSTRSDIAPETKSAMLSAFGSVQKSMISLWMAVTGGDDWSQYYYIIDKTSAWRGFVFMFYIAFFVIAAMNIVTGTFVNKAFDIARPDVEAIIEAKRLREAETYKSLAELFKRANKSKTGTLSRDEFVTVVSKEKHATLEIMGITHVDAESLFELMKGGDKDGMVELRTFADGMLGLSGGAKGVDVHLSEYRILEKLRDINYTLNSLMASTAV